jgi:DNA-binding XRE family transcriptional regulator
MLNAPGLLTRARSALGMSQEGFGELLGVSRRTMVRWQGGSSGPSYENWMELVRHVHPKSRALAVEIATELEETLVSLGLEAPPAPAVTAPEIPAAPARPSPPVADLVDSIVCAAAEAVASTPQAIRPALLAAFERAASLGLQMDEVRGALRPSTHGETAQNSG